MEEFSKRFRIGPVDGCIPRAILAIRQADAAAGLEPDLALAIIGFAHFGPGFLEAPRTASRRHISGAGAVGRMPGTGPEARFPRRELVLGKQFAESAPGRNVHDLAVDNVQDERWARRI